MNLSEGRDLERLRRWADEIGPDLLDVHHDPDHHRSVFTMVGTDAPRQLARSAVAELDIGDHRGVHPRIGVVDVVPFVPLAGSTIDDATQARDEFARWASDELHVPCFLYGPERSLPDIRRQAFIELLPDTGPHRPHPSAGAMAVGCRPVLVAYNLWLRHADLPIARRIAAAIRGSSVRALGLQVGEQVQVSCNLIEPAAVGPAEVYDMVSAHHRIERAELVGLIPDSVLQAVPPSRWSELDVSPLQTIEERLRR